MNMKKTFIIVIPLLVIATILGSTYAYFNYTKTGASNFITGGTLNLDLSSVGSTNSITIQNVLPMSSHTARSQTDNTISFAVTGQSSSSDEIKYNILLTRGDDVTNKTRFRDSDLRFDLVKTSTTEGDVYLVRGESFSSLNDKVIYSKIFTSSDGAFTDNYMLRMWLGEDVIISETEQGENVYDPDDLASLYASVRVAVSGNNILNSGSAFANHMNTFPSFVTTNKTSIINAYFKKINAQDETKYTNATYKEEVSYQNIGKVKIWLDEVASGYDLYVESDGMTYLNTAASLFKGFTSLESIVFENVNTINVTDMSEMFSNCSSLTTLDLSSFNTDKVTDMSEMFNGCSSLISLDISGFVTHNVTDMSSMFKDCSDLETLDLSKIITSKVTDMSHMFSGCESIEEINLTNFDTALVQNMSGMFHNCLALENIIFDDIITNYVTDMSEMFSGCSTIINLDLTRFNTASVTNIDNMFIDCTLLERIYVTYDWDTRNVTLTEEDAGVFSGDTHLVGGSGTAYSVFNYAVDYARIDNPTTEPGYFTYKEAL